MKIFASVAASAIALAAATSASASEASPFAGPYVGIQLSISDLETAHTDVNEWHGGRVNAKNTDDAVQFGLKAGYDVVVGPVIAGVLAEAKLGKLDSNYEVSPSSPDYEIGSKFTTLGSVRAKLGLTQDNLAIFATGGLALADANHRYQETDGSGEYFRNNGRRTGYVLGGGAEYAISKTSSIGVDYSIYNFSKRTHILQEQDGSIEGSLFTLKDTIQSYTASYVVRF